MSEIDFYTIPEAAKELGVSQSTIWRWIASRRLPAYRVGPRRIRISKHDLGAVVRPVHRAEEAALRDGVAEANGAKTPGIFAGYEPRRVKEALRKSAGCLRDLDREKLLADLRSQRGQSSLGRRE